MKSFSYLKKPISLKKIRSYNDFYKKEDFFLNNSSSFKKDFANGFVVKSSYLEKIMDLNSLGYSNFKLNGNYFSITLKTNSKISEKNSIFAYCSKQNFFELNNFKNDFNPSQSVKLLFSCNALKCNLSYLLLLNFFKNLVTLKHKILKFK